MVPFLGPPGVRTAPYLFFSGNSAHAPPSTAAKRKQTETFPDKIIVIKVYDLKGVLREGFDILVCGQQGVSLKRCTKDFLRNFYDLF